MARWEVIMDVIRKKVRGGAIMRSFCPTTNMTNNSAKGYKLSTYFWMGLLSVALPGCSRGT